MFKIRYRVKDFADGWIYFKEHEMVAAEVEARLAGALMQECFNGEWVDYEFDS